jgi:DNA polymerase III subunit epsilon
MSQPPRYPRRAAAPAHLRTRTELRAERLQLPSNAWPAAYYWQGFHDVALFDPADARPMRPARASSAAQLAALAAGRALAGTARCRCCQARVDRDELDKAGMCGTCVAEAMQAEIENEWQAVLGQAAALLTESPLFLDTETTGIDDNAEPVEVAVIDSAGVVLFESLVRPCGTIPADAQAVHGLSDIDVMHAPAWPEIAAAIGPLLAGRLVISHHAAFDHRIISQACTRHNLSPILYRTGCTMELLEGINGGRWPSLDTAAALVGTTRVGQSHRARADAETCRQVLLALASRGTVNDSREQHGPEQQTDA